MASPQIPEALGPNTPLARPAAAAEGDPEPSEAGPSNPLTVPYKGKANEFAKTFKDTVFDRNKLQIDRLEEVYESTVSFFPGRWSDPTIREYINYAFTAYQNHNVHGRQLRAAVTQDFKLFQEEDFQHLKKVKAMEFVNWTRRVGGLYVPIDDNRPPASCLYDAISQKLEWPEDDPQRPEPSVRGSTRSSAQRWPLATPVDVKGKYTVPKHVQRARTEGPAPLDDLRNHKWLEEQQQQRKDVESGRQAPPVEPHPYVAPPQQYAPQYVPLPPQPYGPTQYTAPSSHLKPSLAIPTIDGLLAQHAQMAQVGSHAIAQLMKVYPEKSKYGGTALVNKIKLAVCDGRACQIAVLMPSSSTQGFVNNVVAAIKDDEQATAKERAEAHVMEQQRADLHFTERRYNTGRYSFQKQPDRGRQYDRHDRDSPDQRDRPHSPFRKRGCFRYSKRITSSPRNWKARRRRRIYGFKWP
jgi:hypothetical protein